MGNDIEKYPPEFRYLTDVEDIVRASTPHAPRLVVIAPRRWMEPYHHLEELELNVRFQVQRDLQEPLYLWLRAMVLFREPFVGRFEWSGDLTDDEKAALTTRADLLALAAGSSKPALDSLLSGYYWPASGQIRSLLDAGRRVGYVRLKPSESMPYFQAPEESPIGDDGNLKPGLPRLRYETMRDAFYAASKDEKKAFDLLSIGTKHLDWGAHPSGEGILQLYAGNAPHKVIGPIHSKPFAAFLLKWGLFAHLALLDEVHMLRPQGREWVDQFRLIGSEFSAWQIEYNREFGDEFNDALATSAEDPEDEP